MLPVGVKVRVVESYSNAELSQAFSFTPPVINTLPEFSCVAACPTRAGESAMFGSAFATPAPRQAKSVSNKGRWNDFFISETVALAEGTSFPKEVYDEINVVSHQSKSFSADLARSHLNFSFQCARIGTFPCRENVSTTSSLYFAWDQTAGTQHCRWNGRTAIVDVLPKSDQSRRSR